MAKHQLTNTILMVRPVDFVFNEQTAQDNEFQHIPETGNVTEKALSEFENAVNILEKEGIQVLVVEKDAELPAMPDAVFPNNWFGTDDSGRVHVFPMKTPNRKSETQQLDQVLGLLEEGDFHVSEIIEWEEVLGEGLILEGTGSLILDRVNGMIYAAISERTNENATKIFAEKMGWTPVLFHAESGIGTPYYHTNVIMSVGEKMAVVCLECIPDMAERKAVRDALAAHHKIIEISRQQLESGFCGNLLQVKNPDGQPITVLSQTAFDSLTEMQKSEMLAFGKLVAIAIPTIEYVGGGSIRCMMAEVFCPKN